MPKKDKRESQPYRAAREYENAVLENADSRAFVAYRDLIRALLREDVKRDFSKMEKAETFRIRGRVYLDPTTGKPLTREKWKKIREQLDVALRFVYSEEAEERIAKRAVLLGRILTTMDRTARLPPVIPQKVPSYLENVVLFAEQHAGELITGLRANAKKRVVSEIISAQRERVGPKVLETRLFETYINVHRDWRRIAETEIANNLNNGFLTTHVQKGTRYLRGLSSADACDFCKENVNEQVVAIGDVPNSTGFVYAPKLKRQVPYVWPGKSNYGRKRANWWVASGAQHPHCRCTWQGYEPGLEVHDKRIEDRLAALLVKEA